MEQNNHQKFYGLDHLRALAIILVFLSHYVLLSGQQPEWLNDISGFGWTGVDLFFVLSGFLISSQLFTQIKNGCIISFKQFFLKRFFRIIPAFLVTVLIYFCIPSFREKESLPPLWRFLTFTQNFGLDLRENRTFSHCWSLCVEEHFYLLLPFTLIIFQKSKMIHKAYWLLITLFILGFVTRFYSYNLYLPESLKESSWTYWYKYVYYPTYNRLDGLLIGVTIAAINKFLPKIWNKFSKYGNLFIFLGLVLLTFAYVLCKDQMTFNASIFGFPLISISYGFLVLGALCPTTFLYKWNSKVTAYIATLSYAIYLTHKGIIHITFKLIPNLKNDSSLLFLICIVICLGFAYILNWAVEKPFMKLRNRMTK